MLAGITGIDLVMLVIAADESVMPQTREHFDICKLLGVRQGIIVITKTDVAEPDLVDLVRLEAEDLAAGSFLESAPVVPVSSTTGAGIDRLRAELERTARSIQEKNSRHHFRLPIDRVFVMKGFGTVTTGTLVSGSLDVESEVEIHPIRKRARVRGLQVHGETTASASAGQRTAVNLAGIDTESLHRGMVLSAPGRFEAANQIDCVFELLPNAKPLKHRSPVHFHSGTAEIEAQVYFLDRRPQMKAGERAYVQFRLGEPALVLPGDRFIVRRFSPVITIGGGTVLDSLAPRHRLKEPWRERLEVLEKGEPPAVLAEHLKASPHGLGALEIVSRTAWLESDIEGTARQLEKAGEAVVVQSVPLWISEQWQERKISSLFH
jgi:selenocysteine-specific elongation factor